MVNRLDDPVPPCFNPAGRGFPHPALLVKAFAWGEKRHNTQRRIEV